MSAPLAVEGRIQNVQAFRSNWDEIFKKDKEDAVITKCAEITAKAKKAYELYCEHCNWKSYNGTDLPKWEAVRDDIKSHWEYVVINL